MVMGNDVIVFENVTKRYGEKIALNNVSFRVQKGEFISIIGSSGCGKTTLLQMINGLLEPDEGKIFVYGEDISTADKVGLRRRIGYAIQEVGLFPHMTVRGNIEYLPRIIGKKNCKNLNIRSARELMKIVGLDESLLTRYPSELSGGQRQRVGLARALAASPEILLMDEAFAAVDEITRQYLQDEIAKIHRTLGITVVFVTHSIREAVKLASRIFVMDSGCLIQTGTAAEIQQNPVNEFVKELMSKK